METRDVLLKMRGWIEVEIEKANKEKHPYADSFILTSLAFCAEKAVGTKDAEGALALLRSTAAIERHVGTYDVVSPHGAIFLLNCALERC